MRPAQVERATAGHGGGERPLVRAAGHHDGQAEVLQPARGLAVVRSGPPAGGHGGTGVQHDVRTISERPEQVSDRRRPEHGEPAVVRGG